MSDKAPSGRQIFCIATQDLTLHVFLTRRRRRFVSSQGYSLLLAGNRESVKPKIQMFAKSQERDATP
jgi:hypothetical protein